MQSVVHNIAVTDFCLMVMGVREGKRGIGGRVVVAATIKTTTIKRG